MPSMSISTHSQIATLFVMRQKLVEFDGCEFQRKCEDFIQISFVVDLNSHS